MWAGPLLCEGRAAAEPKARGQVVLAGGEPRRMLPEHDGLQAGGAWSPLVRTCRCRTSVARRSGVGRLAGHAEGMVTYAVELSEPTETPEGWTYSLLGRPCGLHRSREDAYLDAHHRFQAWRRRARQRGGYAIRLRRSLWAVVLPEGIRGPGPVLRSEPCTRSGGG